MQSKAKTVAEYLDSLPPDRRSAIEAVRKVILRHLDKNYQEGMGYGMIGYSVPHRIYPAGYHCKPSDPLPFAGIASQKGHMSVYLMSLYGPDSDEAWFRDAWAATGKRLDMGKCCVRFKRIEDVPLDIIGEAIRRMPVERWIEKYERNLLSMNKAAAAKAATRKAATRKAASSPPKPATNARTGQAADTAKKTRAKKSASKATGSKSGTSSRAPRSTARRKTMRQGPKRS